MFHQAMRFNQPISSWDVSKASENEKFQNRIKSREDELQQLAKLYKQNLQHIAAEMTKTQGKELRARGDAFSMKDAKKYTDDAFLTYIKGIPPPDNMSESILDTIVKDPTKSPLAAGDGTIGRISMVQMKMVTKK